METTTAVLSGKITDLPNSRGFEMHNGDIIEARVRFKGLLSEKAWGKDNNVTLPLRVTGSQGKWREVGAKIMGTTTWNACPHSVTITMTEYFTESANADFEMQEVDGRGSGDDDPSDPRNIAKD